MELIYEKIQKQDLKFGEVEYAGVLVSSNNNQILANAKYIIDDSEYITTHSKDKDPKGARQSTINQYVLEQLDKIKDIEINSISDEEIEELFINN